MKKILLYTIILIFSVGTFAFAVQLKWDMHPKDRLEIVKTADVKFYVNKQLRNVYSERNIIDLTCYNVQGKSNQVKGAFTLYTRPKNQSVFKFTNRYFSDFIIDSDGKYVVGKNTIMPNLRHIPTFPEKELKAGSVWSAPAELIIDNFSEVIALQLDVHYKFQEVKERKGENIAVIYYVFKINKNLENKAYPEDFPSRIIGKNEGILLWNIDKNRPFRSQDNYHIIFLFRSGNAYNSYEFVMNILTDNNIYRTVTEEEKDAQKEELEEDLKDEEGVSVEKNEEGLVIRMGEILFDFDSYDLKDDTQKTLDNIIKIIKEKYPDNEIIIEGHTDNVGDDEYNQKLSEKRAKAVADFMDGDIEHDKLSYKGYGQEQPLNDNSTAEKRQQNRRVDIIIKTN